MFVLLKMLLFSTFFFMGMLNVSHVDGFLYIHVGEYIELTA